MTRTARALLALGLAAGAAVGSVGTASAATPSVDHYAYDLSFDIPNLCGSGLDVHGHAVGRETDMVRTNSGGFPLFSSKTTGYTVYTSGAHRASVRYAGPEQDLRVVDKGDGTITVYTSLTGAAVVFDSSGRQAYREAGRLLITTVLDDKGTPSNPDDDVVLSENVVTSGPKGDGETSLCNAVVAVLRG